MSNVEADPVGTTTATLTATRRNFCGTFPTFHFRYRVKGTTTWTEIERIPESHSRFRQLTGLTPATTYEVEASFHETFAHPYKIEFRTLPLVPEPPAPSLVAINLVEAKRTELTVVVKVADAAADTAVHLLYQNLRSDTFSTRQSAPVTNSEARFPLSGLVSGTRYRLWASLDKSLVTDALTPATKPDDVLSAEFTTLPPGVLGVAARTTGQTSARLAVTIVDPNGLDQSVYTQFRTTNPEGDWVAASEIPTTTIDTAIVDLTGLTSDTEYEARASLDTTFPEDETETSNVFRTWPPGVEGLSVKDLRQTSATIVVDLSAANGSTLYLIYRPVGGTWAGTRQPVAEAQTSVEFPLTGLMSGTEYEVRISYDSRLQDLIGQNTPRGLGSQSETTVKSRVQRSVPTNQHSVPKSDPVDFNELQFSTLPPNVVSVAVDDQTVSQSGATVTVTVKEPNGTAELHIRYSTDSSFPNRSTETESKVVPTTTNANGEDTIDFLVTGLDAGSTYYVEASFNDGFPTGNATKSTNFTTDPPSPAVSSVEVLDSGDDEITQTGATARVIVTNPNATDEVHIRYSTDSSFAQGSTIVTDSATPGISDTSSDFILSDLTSGTIYYVQASYDDTFPPGDATKSTDFTTDPPTITDVTASAVTQTTATVVVTVDEPNDTSVQLHYRAGTGSWSTADPNYAVLNSNDGTYAFDLTGLTTGSAYTVYASFDSTPPLSGAILAAAQTDTFTTLDLNFVDVTASEIDQTSATVTVMVDVSSSKAVQLYYRRTSATTWSGPMSATVSLDSDNSYTADFALSRLTSGTAYTVFASLDSTPPSSENSLPAAQTDSFTTYPPSIEKLVVTGKTDTTAEVTVTIAEPNGQSQTVMVRYQTTPSGNWVVVQPDPTTTSGTVVVDLTGLTTNTQYRVEATLSSGFSEGVKFTTFTTDSTGPGVSDVTITNESQTGATAVVNIANPGTAARTVYLRYRESGSDSRSDPPLEAASTTATPGTAVRNLEDLTSGTQYEVQASLDSTFASGVQSATFRTLPPSASGVSALERNPTFANVRVTVSEPNGKATLFLRFGAVGNWRRDFATNVSEDEVDFTLAGLEPDTAYAVEASFDSGFPSDATATTSFRTPQLDAPTVGVPNPGQTTATAEITVVSADHQNGVVYWRYQETPSGSWSSLRAAAVTGGSATANLSGLTSNTEYKVEASLIRTFPTAATGSKTFTTDPPSVSQVDVTDKSNTTAEVTVTIAAPNGNSQTVYLEYDTTANTAQDTWGNSKQGSSTTNTAVIDLGDLSSGTQYTVRASLTADFSGETRTATFTTTSNSPHVSGVEVADNDIQQTTATATVTIANVTAATDVFLRYRTTPSGSWSDPVLETSSTTAVPGTATTELTGLTSGTQYEVQASLDNTFASGVQSTTFTTKPPSVSSVTVSGETSSGATITVAVSAPNGEPVFVQYRTGTNSWIHRFKNVDAGETSVEFRLSGLASGTAYTVQASFDTGFPANNATKTATFSTEQSSPSFTDGDRTFRSVEENTPPGKEVGAPIPVNEGEADQLSFTLVQSLDSKEFTVSAVNVYPQTGTTNVVAAVSGLVGADFDVDDTIANAVQIFTHSPLDYEARNVYLLTISAADGVDGHGEVDLTADTSILVTVLVTDVEEEGTVTLSAATPRVGEALTAAVADADGGVTGVGWVWERSEDRSTWTAIDGATSDTYTPVADDEGHFLRVTASYTDRRGPDKRALAQPDKPVAVGFDEEFTDVDDSNEHSDAIEELASHGVFVDTECDDQLFCPQLGLKRWEMAVWILRVLVDYPPNIVGISRFQDIPDGKWWIRYVEHLYARKITIGCETEPLQYCPHDPVTRAQMASFLVRALDLPPAPAAGFTDTDRTAHAANIDALHRAGITIGCATEPLQYCPHDPVTRAQMATFLYRMASWLDRQALIALYNATNGPNWTNNTNWATTKHLDQWYGVRTDQTGGVTALLLAGNGLHGPIPHALTNLTHLQTLELSANVLTGCIPQSLQDIPTTDLSKLGLPTCD